jgi:hypothetical protein
MMLAFGRAVTAAIALAGLEFPTEAEAVTLVSQAGTKELPKRMRRLLRGKLDQHDFARADAALGRPRDIAERRHHLIHGEWWFNVFDRGLLEVRAVRSM